MHSDLSSSSIECGSTDSLSSSSHVYPKAARSLSPSSSSGAREEALLPPTLLPGSVESQRLEISTVCHLIETCEFVAVDLEFSGLFANYKKCNEIQKHYQMCVENVSNFTALQLGVCVVSRSPENLDEWVFSPFNFYAFPSDRQVFQCDSMTMKWLSTQGFDFAKWIKMGYDYTRLGVLASEHVPRDIREFGLQRIVEAIAACSKPLVVHNGLLDMLHIFDKFIQPLPQTIEQFACDWQQIFTGGVYDTKRLAQLGRSSLFNSPNVKSMNLEELRSALLSKPNSSTTFSVCPDRLQEQPEYILNSRPYDSHEKSHEAGFDSMLTAQTFILEIESFWRLEQSQGAAPSRAGESVQPRQTTSHTSIPLNWQEIEIFQNVRDVLELPSIRPGELRLNNYLPTHPTREEQRHRPSDPSQTHRSFSDTRTVPKKDVTNTQSPVRRVRQNVAGPQETERSKSTKQRKQGMHLHPKLKELFERHEELQRFTNSESVTADSKPQHEKKTLAKKFDTQQENSKAQAVDTTTGSTMEVRSDEAEEKSQKSNTSKKTHTSRDEKTPPDSSAVKTRNRRRRRKKVTSTLVAAALSEAESALRGTFTEGCAVKALVTAGWTETASKIAKI